jgi:hypothetical protein
MQTRHDALPCGVSALLLNPDRECDLSGSSGEFDQCESAEDRDQPTDRHGKNHAWPSSPHRRNR